MIRNISLLLLLKRQCTNNLLFNTFLLHSLVPHGRFRSLWNVRYEVFPKIPRDVQRRIRNHELHLGYALPTPLLGNEIKDIPLSPWQPVTLCTGECARDPNVSVMLLLIHVMCSHPRYLC